MDFNEIQPHINKIDPDIEIKIEGHQPYRRITATKSNVGFEIYEDDFKDIPYDNRQRSVEMEVTNLNITLQELHINKTRLLVNMKCTIVHEDDVHVHVIKSIEGHDVTTYCSKQVSCEYVLKSKLTQAITCVECIATRGTIVQ